MLATLFLSAVLAFQLQEGDTGKPIEGHVIAWEISRVYAGHGGSDICYSAAGGRIPARGGTIELPMFNLNALQAAFGERRSSTLAFARGHCAAGPYNTGFGAVPERSSPIRLRASKDPAEYRLLYLAQVAGAVRGACFMRSDRSFTASMDAEILAEAQSIARTGRDRFLVARIRDQLQLEMTHTRLITSLVDVLRHTPPEEAVKKLENILEFRRASPTFKEAVCRNGMCSYPGTFPKDVYQPIEPFHIDERAEDGRTGLMEAANAMNVPAMQYLLAQGASASILTHPGGIGALDLLLVRAEKDVNGYAADGVEGHLLRAIDVLVGANATLHAANRRLLSRPGEWKLEPRAQSFWTRVAEKTANVPGRESAPPSCPARDLQPALLRLGTAPPG